MNEVMAIEELLADGWRVSIQTTPTGYQVAIKYGLTLCIVAGDTLAEALQRAVFEAAKHSKEDIDG